MNIFNTNPLRSLEDIIYTNTDNMENTEHPIQATKCFVPNTGSLAAEDFLQKMSEDIDLFLKKEVRVDAIEISEAIIQVLENYDFAEDLDVCLGLDDREIVIESADMPRRVSEEIRDAIMIELGIH